MGGSLGSSINISTDAGAVSYTHLAEQFERIMNDSGFVRLRRLSTDEIVGTEKSAGPVSYTHLDVYKRQTLIQPLFQRFL